MVAAATAPQPIRIEVNKAGAFWEYTVHHDAVVDPMFPVVVGDYLFNLRSALDHIAAANRLKKTARAPFPIFHDPIMNEPAGGEPAVAKRLKRYRDIWAEVRANTFPDAFEIMDRAQPFNAGPGYEPANTALAILNELQNRDKHASLAVVTTGIGDVRSTLILPDGAHVAIPGPKLPEGLFVNGATIFREAHEARIETEGTVKLAIAAGPTGALRGLPEAFEEMSSEVAAVLRVISSVMRARA